MEMQVDYWSWTFVEAVGGQRIHISRNIAEIYYISSYPIYQRNHSPYMLGLSERKYASNVLFSTVDQDRSCSSSSASSSRMSFPSTTVRKSTSVVSGWVSINLATASASRSVRSPLMNRGPRSGKFLAGSKGSHLPYTVHQYGSRIASEARDVAYQKLWK